MSTVNSKNVTFIILFLLVLATLFGVVTIVGTFDPSSIYTRLIYGDKESGD